MSAVRKESKITEHQFWWQVKQYTRTKIEAVSMEQERREWDVERVRLAASLPTEANLNKVQRYEAHLSLEFYKALYELQRLQAARQRYRFRYLWRSISTLVPLPSIERSKEASGL